MLQSDVLTLAAGDLYKVVLGDVSSKNKQVNKKKKQQKWVSNSDWYF